MQMLKRIIKNNTTYGLRSSITNVITELKINRLHQKGLRRAHRLRATKDLKLHFGCGSNIKEGYINIDLNDKADVSLDLRERLPFLDESCSFIYSEHFLEHLEYDQAILFLKECNRVLKPGGVFSVGVPNAEWPIRAYAGDINYAEWFQYVKENAFPEGVITNMECVNHSFRQGNEHKFAYDFETLKRSLEMAGFTNVKCRDFIAGLDSEKSRFSLCSDKNKCTTLYVDAVKA